MGIGLSEQLFNEICNDVLNLKKKENDEIEYILRNYVIPPIKGEITKSKLKWRGISSLAYSANEIYSFSGIIQRGFLIDINGNKTNLQL